MRASNLGFHSVGSRSDVNLGERVGILEEFSGRTVGCRRGISSLTLLPRGSIRSEPKDV